MTDHLLHAVDNDRGLSVVVANTTAVAQEAEARHFAGRVPAMVLAKTIVGAALLSSGLKDGERQTVQLTFEGEMRGVLAEADAAGSLRAYPTPVALPGVDDSGLSYTASLGTQATMAVVRSRGGVMLYSGSVHSTRPTPRHCFECYLEQSEQAQGAIELCAHYHGGAIEGASGAILRLLPKGDREAFAIAKAKFDTGKVFEMLQSGASSEEVAAMLLVDGHEGGGHIARRSLRFHCPCSRARVIGMIAGLGVEQMREMLEEDGEAEVNCSFCNSIYAITREELEEQIARLEHAAEDGPGFGSQDRPLVGD